MITFIRVPRDKETLMHIQIKGLFPCGEGAGYAGGIVSAAIDGERCADGVKKFFSQIFHAAADHYKLFMFSKLHHPPALII